ncbi:alkylation response protein AidB-like acyl-CoA dehydrogenase [Prauserella isguenensis]|uniref:Alkylation response protein AidB-like acyl-CoA dehydrogenase n=1 Tax=Prauserella isguenensis TaxID=1470180 RepID=A0A839S1S5_9PSEU|nr:alkylation response protein AidB-like acyl-CoA dehydrogenase [Prauserella isguenensis]
MGIAMTDEQRALADAVSAAARSADPAPAIAGIGLPAIALPEVLGGAGGSVTDLVTGVAAGAGALADVGFGTILAGLAWARRPDTVVATQYAPAVAAGSVRAAVAVEPGRLVARPDVGGGLVVDGITSALPDGPEADVLLLAARTSAGPVDGAAASTCATDTVWFAVDAGRTRRTEHEAFDPSRRVATARLDGVAVPATDVLGRVAVPELAATLAAAEAAGVAEWCVRTASEYARVREQFGGPIGAFQAVQHLCAEMLCRSETAAALAWDAARAADTADGDQFAVAAAVAAAGALDAAVDTAKDCIQVLGGIGFTWEHDAHRYLRRAVSLRQLLGGSEPWRRRAGELTRVGVRRGVEVDVDAHAGGDLAATRHAAAAVAAEVAGLDERAARVRLAESGHLAPHWPRPYGLDATPAEQLAIDGEFDRVGVTRPDLVVGAWALPTILEHGSEEQRERFVLPTLRGDVTWCQLFSEPGAGSDLASLRTSAERAEHEGVPGWRLTGQKVWTSLAHEADRAICLARTEPDAPKHRGITYFLVDMRAPGIEVRPLREITGEVRFNEVFLDGVFVPDADVVGEVNGGWALARTTLANERVALGGGSAVGEAVEQLLAAEPDIDAERLGGLVVGGSAVSVLGVRDTVRRLGGGQPGAESSVQKLLGVRHRQEVAETALDVLGSRGVVADDATRSAQHEFLLSRCLSIAGGTTQVLLNVVAQRLLGLPRR